MDRFIKNGAKAEAVKKEAVKKKGKKSKGRKSDPQKRNRETISEIKSYEIQEVTKQELAFGSRIERLMPKYEEIPEEFKRENKPNKWMTITSRWFYKGLAGAVFRPKPEVDTNKALRHLAVVIGSWEPKHEHKMAAVAFLLFLWFEDIEVSADSREIVQ